ncbi:MAG TPA: hypothetical protein VEK33_24455 [Terriglobales bacterium]|nr:hypothetical protein [Terriglobales bacterium]
MFRFSPLLLLLVFISVSNAQKGPEQIRLCVATLENSSLDNVSPAWQREELIKAFQRINKSKDVKKGKAASIDAVALESTKGPDPAVRQNDCRFVLYTNLTRVQRPGEISVPPAGAVGAGVRLGDAQAYPPDYRSATIEYRITEAGDPHPWTSGVVTAQEPQQEETLVSELMDQIASRVASELKKPHPAPPQ